MLEALMLSLPAALIVLAAAESLSRLFLPSNPTFRARAALNLAFEPSGFACYCATPNQVIYEQEEGKAQPDKPRFRINKYGYRGEDFPLAKSAGEIRIVFLGGSHVFDVYAFDYKNEVGFTHEVERRLRNHGYPVRVINAALPGNDTRYFCAKILLDLHRYRPDIIVMSSIWNDLKWISRADDDTLFLNFSPKAIRRNPMTEKINFMDTLCGSSLLYRHGRDAYWRRKLKLHQSKVIHEGLAEPRIETTDFARGLDQYRQNLAGGVALARSIGAVPVLAVEERFVASSNTDEDKSRIPYHMTNVRNHDELVRLFNECDAIIHGIARQQDVPVIDIARAMEGQAQYFHDHIHTTTAGSRVIADHYSEFLKGIVEEHPAGAGIRTGDISDAR